MDTNDKAATTETPETKPVHPDVMKDLAALKKERAQLKAASDALRAENEAIKAEREAAQEAGLIEGRKYKELFEKRDAEFKKRDSDVKKLEEQISNDRKKFVESHKLNAADAGVGGFKRPEYKSFIKSENIEVDDQGNIVQESLEKEIARIKQDHPELLKGGEAKPLPADAAPNSVEATTKSLKDASPEEIRMAWRQAPDSKK